MQSLRSLFRKVCPVGRHCKDANSLPEEITNKYALWRDYTCQALNSLNLGAAELKQIETEACETKEKLKLIVGQIDEINDKIKGDIFVKEEIEEKDQEGDDKEVRMRRNDKLRALQDEIWQEKTHEQCCYLYAGLTTMNLLYRQEIFSDYVREITEEMLILISGHKIERSKTNDRQLAKMINTVRFVHGEVIRISKHAEDVRDILKKNFVGKLSDEYYNINEKEDLSFDYDTESIHDINEDDMKKPADKPEDLDKTSKQSSFEKEVIKEPAFMLDHVNLKDMGDVLEKTNITEMGDLNELTAFNEELQKKWEEINFA